MEQSELTQRFAARPQAFAWFLGAGASRSAGLPTATDILWDMKRRFYCREENQDIDRQDLQSDAIQHRIQSFMESRGFPKMWEDGEYERYFEVIFGSDREKQRAYLRGILALDKATLSVGNRVLGAFIASKLAPAIFTTNFDDVVENSVAEVGGQAISAFHIEGSHNILSAYKNEEFPIYGKLHGDFRYDSLKNLTEDLKSQNQDLATCLRNACNRFGLIICGYSGRDKSVMDLLHSVLETTNPFPHGVYWTLLKGSAPSPGVEAFMAAAKKKNVEAHIVFIETYDALMLRLWRNTPNKDFALDNNVRGAASTPVAIPMPSTGHSNPIVRLNALPLIALPQKCHALETKRSLTWDEVRELRSRSDGAVIFTRAEKVLCWGSSNDIKTVVGADFQSLTEADVPQDLSLATNLQIKGFIEEAVVAALARGKPLVKRTNRTSSFVIATPQDDRISELSPITKITGRTAGIISGLIAPPDEFHPEAERVSWAECARVSVEQKNRRHWIVVEPDVWIWPTRARRLATDFLGERRKDRFNAKYNALLDAWIKVLLGTTERNTVSTVSSFEKGNLTENPRFEIGSRSAFTRRVTK
jgi:SIR2-like protein